MSDRDAFLDSIRAQPGDDVARLIYADWLEENGAGDRDRATSEFIRISCDRTGRRLMPQAAYPWLRDVTYITHGNMVESIEVANWPRLVPGLLLEHARRYAGDNPVGRRCGRQIHLRIRLVLSNQNTVATACTVRLWFRRGFLEWARIDNKRALEKLRPVILEDQPLCAFLEENRARAAAVTGYGP